MGPRRSRVRLGHRAIHLSPAQSGPSVPLPFAHNSPEKPHIYQVPNASLNVCKRSVAYLILIIADGGVDGANGRRRRIEVASAVNSVSRTISASSGQRGRSASPVAVRGSVRNSDYSPGAFIPLFFPTRRAPSRAVAVWGSPRAAISGRRCLHICLIFTLIFRRCRSTMDDRLLTRPSSVRHRASSVLREEDPPEKKIGIRKA